MLMPTLCIKSLSNGIPAAILFIPFYLSCSKFLLDFFLGKCYISKCPCSSVDRAMPSGGMCDGSTPFRRFFHALLQSVLSYQDQISLPEASQFHIYKEHMISLDFPQMVYMASQVFSEHP